MNRYRTPLDDLERSVHVPWEQLSEAQTVHLPHHDVEPEDLDRSRLLAAPMSAGRLDPRA